MAVSCGSAVRCLSFHCQVPGKVEDAGQTCLKRATRVILRLHPDILYLYAALQGPLTAMIINRARKGGGVFVLDSPCWRTNFEQDNLFSNRHKGHAKKLYNSGVLRRYKSARKLSTIAHRIRRTQRVEQSMGKREQCRGLEGRPTVEKPLAAICCDSASDAPDHGSAWFLFVGASLADQRDLAPLMVRSLEQPIALQRNIVDVRRLLDAWAYWCGRELAVDKASTAQSLGVCPKAETGPKKSIDACGMCYVSKISIWSW